MLRRTMYGQDITEEQANEMVAPPNAGWTGARSSWMRAQDLMDSGIVAKNDLSPLAEQVDFARNGIRFSGFARQTEARLGGDGAC